MSTVKDLTIEAPVSPRTRVAGYAILARMADKGRADLAGTSGAYHFDCPIDNYLFDFKGVAADDIRKLLEDGASTEEVAAWLDANGIPKTAAEKEAWSDSVDAIMPYDDPELKDWFIGVCAEVSLEPSQTTLFEYLEADDRLSFISNAI